MAADRQSLQERLAPQGRCFGCGPANEKGLRIRSFEVEDAGRTELTCRWHPSPEHEAFDGVLNGGIIGALLDCHSNWTALWHLVERDAPDETPCMVTGDFHVRLRRPTPSGEPLHMVAWATESEGARVHVEAELRAGDAVTATCEGNFFRVGPGHPAYRRW